MAFEVRVSPLGPQGNRSLRVRAELVEATEVSQQGASVYRSVHRNAQHIASAQQVLASNISTWKARKPQEESVDTDDTGDDQPSGRRLRLSWPGFFCNLGAPKTEGHSLRTPNLSPPTPNPKASPAFRPTKRRRLALGSSSSPALSWAHR